MRMVVNLPLANGGSDSSNTDIKNSVDFDNIAPLVSIPLGPALAKY